MLEITSVSINLTNERDEDHLRAFSSITFNDDFIVEGLKIIEKSVNGRKEFFVAMPSRQLKDRCHQCGNKNRLMAKYCDKCGCRLGENRFTVDGRGRAILHADIVHPTNGKFRQFMQDNILDAYLKERALSMLGL